MVKSIRYHGILLRLIYLGIIAALFLIIGGAKNNYDLIVSVSATIWSIPILLVLFEYTIYLVNKSKMSGWTYAVLLYLGSFILGFLGIIFGNPRESSYFYLIAFVLSISSIVGFGLLINKAARKYFFKELKENASTKEVDNTNKLIKSLGLIFRLSYVFILFSDLAGLLIITIPFLEVTILGLKKHNKLAFIAASIFGLVSLAFSWLLGLAVLAFLITDASLKVFFGKK